MAKKKQSKKHKFKYAGAGTSGAAIGSAGATQQPVSNPAGHAAVVPRPAVAARPAAGGRDFSYVGRDLRRIAVLAVGLVALEVVLWYLFAHTGIGPAVYTFVKV